MLAITTIAAPIRVAILGFDDETGMAADKKLGGAIDTESLASKGTHLITQKMIGQANYVLVDQRDFMAQMKKLQLEDEGKSTSLKPSYLDAARALNTDILLRGSLMSFSTGKQEINQGGHHVTMANVSMTVAVQAQDVVDGSVIAMSTGNAKQGFRQTASVQTELSEDDVLDLMSKALDQAVPKVTDGVNKKVKELQKRERIMLSVASTEDPAMVEIDGVLIGSTPMENLPVYKGEHLFHVSRPGYESITKRISLNNNATIKVPMLRTDLSADEKAEILKSADLRAYMMDGKPDLLIQTID
jgi:hypothetical protein